MSSSDSTESTRRPTMSEPRYTTRRIRRWAHEWWVTLRLGRKHRRYLRDLPPFDPDNFVEVERP